MRQRLALFFFT